jgi:HEAT repeat protein
VQVQAVRALGRLGDRRAEKHLKKLLHVEDVPVRREAQEALNLLGQRRS